jgi:hypothetical protein
MNTEENYDGFIFGVVDQTQKKTDFDLGAISSADPLPKQYRTEYKGTIYHQHKTPSCGAHAGVYVKNIQENRDHSPAYLWKRIKQIDGVPPTDGTSMEGIFKALQKFGVCGLEYLENDTEQSLEAYTDPRVLTPTMDADALKSRIGAYAYIWNPTMDQLKRAIYDFKVVLMRIEISADWWNPSWKAKDILPLKTRFPGQGGHFVVATGYDGDMIEGLNEWGITWGDNGKLYFNSDYIGRVTYIGTCFDYVEKAPYIFTRVLSFGSRGTDVGILQQALKAKGYLTPDQQITSYFGIKTMMAVRRFQKDYGLVVDGKVGSKTVAKLM